MRPFFYLLLIIVTNSCVDQDTPETTFTLENFSKHDIRIVPFSRNRVDGAVTEGSAKGELITIGIGGKKTFTRDHRDSRTFYSIKNVDSVRVFFDATKLLVLVCNDWPDMINCSTIFLGDSDNYTHVITENDYDNALDCNDVCE